MKKLIFGMIICVMMASILSPITALAATDPCECGGGVTLYSGGTGIASNPYIITTAEQLDHVRAHLGACFELANNIYLTGEWIPIGDNSTFNDSSRFIGTFDGGGYVINNLYVEVSSNQQYAGLFGYINGATIKNVGVNIGVSGVTATASGSFANSWAGGLVGNSGSGSIIENSYATGNVSASSGNFSYAGGLVGSSGSSRIENSYATGNVDSTSTGGESYAGGLVGYSNIGSTIETSYATGNVSASSASSYSYAGGLVGFNSTSNGRIANSYATGNVGSTSTGQESYAGGLVGYSGNGSTIETSYATGKVDSTSSYPGGLVGFNNSNGKIDNCYWDTETSEQANAVGGGASATGGGGKDTAGMKTDIPVDPDWDFIDIWAIDPAKNGGYPYLIQLYTITFDANGGTVTPSSAITDVDGKLANLPADPTRDGYTFDGWYTDATGGTKVTIDTEFTKNTTVYAHWTKKTTPKPDEPIEPDEPEVVPEVIPEPEPEVKSDPDPTPVPKPETPPITIIVPNNTTTIIIDNGYNRQKSPELYEFFTPSEKKEPVKPVLWENPFGDVNPGDWFYEDVKYVTQKALFEGTSDTTFSPDDTMTYGMVLTVLGRMAKIDTADYGGDGAKYYEPYVNWARANELLGDIADFDPEKYITREDLAVLLYNYAKLMGMDLPEINEAITFNDESEISEYAVEAVAVMQRAGVINGYEDGSFMPKGTATRAEVAAMFHRFCTLK